ncbi:hypothetical protein [uncultured Sphingomonas sp.]|uniref:hypothetical protein n=1 Tax=uncultured Sphingomonas sp. TaxID=158754 RepID=UPI0025CB9D57|nr:hypothetical protein [uncultured Sphingomonas sp.]
MKELDFTGIDPLRVPEARRRITALEEYLALPSPGTADAKRISKTIDLSHLQFQRLARVWRDHRDPRLIVVGKRGPNTRSYGIAPRAIEISNQVIEASPADASVTEIAIEIERLCAVEEVAPPSRPTVWSYVRKARAAGRVPAAGPRRIVIGRMWFHMPVKDQPADAMPALLAAVLLPEGHVIAHRVSVDPLSPPSVDGLLAELSDRRSKGAAALPLVMDVEDRRAAEEALDAAGLSAVSGQRSSTQTDLSRAFNGQLGPLTVIHRRSKARPATRKPETRLEQALDATEAVSVIEAAVASNNAATLMSTPAFDIAGTG